MPVFKNEDNGTWYVMARYVNWKGERKQKCKRGFATKREAQEWERMFKLQTSSDLDMSFEAFTELYINDVKNRLKENTWLTKEHIIRTKILPYFGKLKISEISTKEIITWQNEMLAYRDEKKNDRMEPSMESEKFILTDKPHSTIRKEGFPLDSISLEINTNKYYYDLPEDKLEQVAVEDGFLEFFKNIYCVCEKDSFIPGEI